MRFVLVSKQLDSYRSCRPPFPLCPSLSPPQSLQCLPTAPVAAAGGAACHTVSTFHPKQQVSGHFTTFHLVALEKAAGWLKILARGCRAREEDHVEGPMP